MLRITTKSRKVETPNLQIPQVKNKVANCPPEKEEAIIDALGHFRKV